MAAVVFALGQIVITREALTVLTAKDAKLGLLRHAKADWGDVCAEDWQLNDAALNDSTRLLSAYKSSDGIRFWIITEADRSVTTVLLPEEY